MSLLLALQRMTKYATNAALLMAVLWGATWSQTVRQRQTGHVGPAPRSVQLDSTCFANAMRPTALSAQTVQRRLNWAATTFPILRIQPSVAECQIRRVQSEESYCIIL